MTITRQGIVLLGFAILVLFGIVMIIRKVKAKKVLFNLSFGLYILMIIAFCFFPIRIGVIGEDMPNNFIPFHSIAESVVDSVKNNTPYGMVSVLGNFIMLMPLGIFLYYYIKDLKIRLVNILLVSISIETIQFIISLLIGYNYRCIDIDDVILNVLGGIIACILFNFAMSKFIKRRNQVVESENINKS